MFTLAISCLTTSNLPWFIDLTFQVPMQYCCLQHQTLLLPLDTSTAGRCFRFGSASSFFMELFFPSSLVAYWTPTDLSSCLPVSYLFALSYCSWGPFKIMGVHSKYYWVPHPDFCQFIKRSSWLQGPRNEFLAKFRTQLLRARQSLKMISFDSKFLTHITKNISSNNS